MYAYALGKWTIKAVVQHLIDAERILCNRALVIARKDNNQPLLSFEEKDYALYAHADKRTKEDLRASLKQFSNLQENCLNLLIMNNYKMKAG